MKDPGMVLRAIVFILLVTLSMILSGWPGDAGVARMAWERVT